MGLVGNIKTGSPGPIGLPAPNVPGVTGDDGDDSWVPGPQGVQGKQGVQGVAGQSNVPGPPGDDADDVGFPLPIPGAAGPTGSVGPQGPAHAGLPGEDADDYGWPIPGAPGPTGAAGAGGAGSSSTNELALTAPPATAAWAHTVTQSSDVFADNVGSAVTSNVLKMHVQGADVLSFKGNDITASGVGGSGGWQATAKFRRWWPANGFDAGPGIFVSDGTIYVGLTHDSDGSGGVNRKKFTQASGGSKSNTALLRTNPGQTGDMFRDVWLRIKDDKTNRLFYFSWDGNLWFQLASEARTTDVTHTQIGWGAGVNTVSGTGWGNSGVPPTAELMSWHYEDL